MRVLIADDEPLARRILGSQLQRLGHEVVVVEDGRRALEVLEAADAPRMAILDWNMPELDGTEVCRRLRQQAVDRYIYVALLTVRRRPEDLIAGLEAGADDFLVKPVEVAELRARLRTAERILSSESALLRSRAYLQAVLDNVESGVVLLDGERRIVLTNRAFDAISEVPRDVAVGLDRQEFLSRCAGLFDDFESARRRLTPDETGRQTLRDDVELAHPVRRILRWSSKVVPLPGGDGRLDICRDVTREVDLTRALKEQADRDPLTGLLNRRGGEQAITRELARAHREGKPVALMLIDVDHFKRVNDSFGHDVGDLVLQAVARTVTGALRPYDIVVRWGGEEVLVLAPGADAAGATAVAERVRASVEHNRTAALPRVTVSVGLDHVGPDEQHIGQALSRADTKLYDAKRSGRNCVR